LPVGPPLPRITLIAAMIKFDRFEWLIEKATETGVSRIVPVEAERTEDGLLKAAEKRLERWHRIARESSQQSRRVTMPDVVAPQKLKTAISEAHARKYRLEEEAGAPLLVSAAEGGEDDSAILTGPEGGWTDGERAMLDAAAWSAVSLGPTILRAETAAMVACAILAQTWFRNHLSRASNG
jgi:16S rRNA (uracil1498-N3)-methyltransferase